VNVSDALRAGVGVTLRRPSSVLPFYLLAAGAPAVARVPLLIGVVLALGILLARGRIEPVVRELAAVNPGRVDPAEPTEIPAGLARAIDGLLVPDVVAVLVASAAAFVAVFLVGRGVAVAGTHHAVYAALRGEDPSIAGVVGIGRDWRTFVGIGLIRVGLFLAAAVPALVGALAVPAVGPAAALLVIVSVPLGLAVWVGLAFAGQAATVEGVDALGAVRRSAGFPRRRPEAVIGYVLVAVTLFAVGVIAAVLAGLGGASRIVGLVATLGVLPALDGFKTALYAERTLPPRAEHGSETDVPTGSDDPARRDDAIRHGDASIWRDGAIRGDDQSGDRSDDRSVDRGDDPGRERGANRSRVTAGLRDGLRALDEFVRNHPLANLTSAGLFALGAAAGWLATRGPGTRLEPSGDVASAFGAVPIGPFAGIAANNWLVAAESAFAGLVFGVPAAATMLFNGALVGGIAGVYDPAAFLALVAPHGVVELPALAVGGGLGLHLGRVGLDALRGRRSATAVSAALERAFRVLVGLAVAFVAAAFVEAFLTPRLAAWILGG
jgi:uncharacterized membrane protein SpoIIM required for sporulation